jgi:hypothetical protein
MPVSGIIIIGELDFPFLETNENWDERTLQDVAEKKHGEKDRKRPNQTDIVSRGMEGKYSSMILIWFYNFRFRFASIFSMQSRTPNMDGNFANDLWFLK